MLRRLKAKPWKRLQSLAYAFYVLVFAHLLLMLGPSAVAGGVVAQENVVVYAVVFGGYFISRIWRAVCDRHAYIDLASTAADQGFKN